jgi:hypothetical protein
MADIVVHQREDGHGYDVTYSDLFSSRLGKDEALGIVAAILFGASPYYMRREEQREGDLIRQIERSIAFSPDDTEYWESQIADEKLGPESAARVREAILARRGAA